MVSAKSKESTAYIPSFCRKHFIGSYSCVSVGIYMNTCDKTFFLFDQNISVSQSALLAIVSCGFCEQVQQSQRFSMSQLELAGSNVGSGKLHNCPHCQYCASTAYNLKVHINNRHTNEVKFECNQCPFYSYTKTSLNYHLKSHNQDEYQDCPQCSYRTHSKSGLLNHIKTHQKERPFKCPHCPYAAARKMTLKEHMEVLHNARREVFCCEKCSFKTNWARALKKHMKAHNGDLHTCSRCYFQVDDKQKLIEHEVEVHNMEHRELYCPHCTFSTDQQYKLEDHIHKRHEDNDRVLMYSCPECDYKTKWKRLIKGHRRVHTGELFRCKKCDFATITKTRLNEHEMTHLDMSERGFACPHCSYRATRQTRLNEHITNRHFPEKKALHKCDRCEFTTLWKSYLKVHQKMHTGEVFRCSRCSYSSPVRSQMLRHERSLHKIGVGRITTGNNLYKCSQCPYSAARKGRLQEHIEMRHSRISNRVYYCPVCTFKTIWKKSLKVHVAVHEEEWFTCDLCLFKTLTKDEFKEHVQSHVSDKGYSCMLCEFISDNVEDFNQHLLEEHSEPNPAQVRSNLSINYLQSHATEETSSILTTDPQQCDLCNFSSSSPLAFKAHLITHLDTLQQEKLEEKSLPKMVYRKVLDGAVLPLTKKDIVY